MSNRLKSFALASLVFSLTCGVGLAASDVVVKHTLAQTAASSDGKAEADKLFIENSWTGNIRFKIMEPQQRQRMTNDLQQLEQQEKAKGATAEGIAFAKAKYFLEQETPLWSDALQQAYSVDKPSPELVKMREEIVKYLCNPN
ncbi:MAG: hypothetical protein HC903_04170 [Methylacidiphilales bacterium]|nr:hypothetical protein [Candidatus Methylacidiphilales bacterium]